MNRRKLAQRVLLGVLALGAVAGAAYALFPLELAELGGRYDLWREGVRTVESAGLKGYLQDRCDQTYRPGARTQECTCVAMIHGLADNAMTWRKILLWPSQGWLDPVKLYAFDLPGTGGSPVPSDPSQGYRVRNQARALQKALAPLCPRWMVVGNSLGGWVAAWLALEWPEGVSKLILLDSAGLKANASSRTEELQAFLEPTVAALQEFQRRAYYRGRPLPANVWRAAVARMKQSNARQVIEAQTPEDFLDGRISALRKPTYVLWGQADQLIPVSEGRTLKAQIPGAVWQEVPECGHLPQKECPLEVIKAIGNMVNFGSV